MNNSHEMNFGGGGVMGSTSLPDSSISRKTAHVVRDQFPAGLRVLVVDDDRTCLTILEKMLRTCRYETTKCKRAKEALEMLRENKNRFDVVISDVHMPDMDGFRLLESIGLEMDLPVIMMSADDSSHVVMKGVTHGACDYLIKPVRIEALKNIWQHVIRKKQNEIKDIEQLSSLDDGDRQHQQDENEYLSPANEGNWKSAKRKGDEEESEDNTNTATLKKPRVVWSVELHQQFVAAVNQLGIDKAVPKKILELMNFHGLTRENVASHLQKYRLYLRRLSGVPQHHSGLNNAFMGPQDSAFAAMPSLGRIEYQALAVTAQLPAQTLAAYQAGVGCSGVKPGITMPFVDQRNLFSFESSKLRHGERQQLSNSDKQMNLLHGIPTSMEPKQLASLHQSAAHPMRGVNMQMGGAHCGQSGSVLMQMVQSQSRGHLLNESVGSQASQMQSSSGQTLPSNTASVGILSRIGIAENPTSGLSYNPVTHSSSMVDFSVNKIIVDLPGNGFPLGGTPGMNSLISEGGLVPGELKMSHIGESNGGFAPSYDIFNYRQQNRSRDYQLQNSSAMSSYGASHSQPMTPNMHNNINVSPSVLVHQAFSSGHQKNEQSGNALIGKTTVFSAGPNHHQQGIPFNTKQHLNSFDNSSMSTKEGRLQDIGTGTNLFQEQYGQDDLLSAILKQQQDLTAGECYLDDYPLDNFHVNEVLTSQ